MQVTSLGRSSTRSRSRRGRKSTLVLAVLALVAGLFAGVLLGYSMTLSEINRLQDQISGLQEQISSMTLSEINRLQDQISGLREQISQLQLENNAPTPWDNTLSDLYEMTKDSVVVVQGTVAQTTIFGTLYEQVQGSGFVYSFDGRMVIITNFHVVDGAENITVTFSDGNAYAATVLGSDAYADLAVLSTEAPEEKLKPLQIVSSSTLKVGDPVVAIGSPFGLAGSMSVGIISQLGRTIRTTSGGYSIANIIQTTAPLNPGNSGGPLLNYRGQVVGITTAIVADSQGLGFAVPSNTILREIGPLVETGSYNQHPWLGVSGVDMNYEIARAMGADVTYGWLITRVVSGSPADRAGLRGGTEQYQTSTGTILIGGDVVIAINGVRVSNGDEFLSYMEEHTLPNQTVTIKILRSNRTMDVLVELGARPPPS
jgi:S1-C subfamily serine protease